MVSPESEGADTSAEMKSFLQLVYSLCKQYISWYERELKTSKTVV
jgi:hypothetical protein